MNNEDVNVFEIDENMPSGWVTCPNCELEVQENEFNLQIGECQECHTKCELSYNECGCEECWEKVIARVGF